jgi:membrane associated rhomboid family serine protease
MPIFPTTDRSHRPPVVTGGIIALTVLVFFWQLLWSGQAPPGFPPWASPAAMQLALDPSGGRWWTILSHALVHAGWMHLIFNMLGLVVFGPLVEARLGRIGFGLLYVCGAVGAALAHIGMTGAPAVGASGAIAAVAGAFLILWPTVRLMVPMATVPIPAWVLIGLYIAKDLYLSGPGHALAGNIATWAHLGGYGVGIVSALALLWTRLVSRSPFDVISMFERWRRKSAFRAGVAEGQRAAASRRVSPVDEQALNDIALRRAAISERVAARDLAGAARLYAELVAAHAGADAATTLPRKAQLELATHLMATGQRTLGVLAYERFAKMYRDEPESRQARLLVATVCLREFNQPERAAGMLSGLRTRLSAAEDVALFDELKAELDRVRPDPGAAML